MRLILGKWTARIFICAAFAIAAAILLMRFHHAEAPRVLAAAAKSSHTAANTAPAFPAPEPSMASPMPSAPAPISSWDKRWWIEKASRVLRAGNGLSPEEDIEYLETLSREDIARLFMEDPRFGDAVLDFNMFFLGYKVDQLRQDGAYVFEAHDFANAVNAAKAVLNDGDFLTLFDLEGSYYLPPLSPAPTEDEKAPEDAKLTPAQLRQKAAGELFEPLEALIDMVDNPTPASVSAICAEIGDITEEWSEIAQNFYRAFADEEVFFLNRSRIPDFIYEDMQKIQSNECESVNTVNMDTDILENKFWDIYGQLNTAFAEIFKFDHSVYAPQTIADLKPLDLSALPSAGPWPVFGYRQSIALANSSTNYNRKRAAYVLKRFFCDDLNPVGFDMPKEHVDGAHGSQTSCFSCHYKLDPIAGFFRNYGAQFADISNEPSILFDDGAEKDYKAYLENWRGPETPTGTWEIGYIRSPRWKDSNDYGQSLADLSQIIRKAPEAKRCLMKRMTQYVLGEHQTVDGGYIDALAEEFEREAKQNSSQAFKNAMIRILKSTTFTQRNPDPNKCYDRATPAGAGNRPPCRIDYILEKNCVLCHDESKALNRLDLSTWGQPEGAPMPNFGHAGPDGSPVEARVTLAEIAERLISNDPDRRMPRNMTMSSQERQELFLWVQEQLGAGAGSQ